MILLDGKKLSKKVLEEIKVNVQKLDRVPHLVVILVGDDPASNVYVRNKQKAALEVGIKSSIIKLEENISEQELLSRIDELNNNPEVTGILVQLPLPKHISEDKVIAAISAEKDVDGFHPENVARLWLNQHCILPCTPKGIIELLDQAGVEMAGKKAVVIGRSNIVGKPVAKLLLDRNATVTIAHSRTKDLAAVCREADILVAAVGRAKMVTAEYVKPGAAVIDVGINRTADGKLVGDVDYDAVQPVAGAITPVPGGVGPMTITMLMRNTIECFLNRMNNK